METSHMFLLEKTEAAGKFIWVTEIFSEKLLVH